MSRINLSRFPRYTEFDPLVAVHCVTPGDGRVIHRFFDTDPISPGGRFLALTRFPFEDRSPAPGDAAEVILCDLQSGEQRNIAKTAAWGSQLGAQVQWGATDKDLYFNVMEQMGKPKAVRYDPESGSSRKLKGTVYHLSPDGALAVSPCLLRTGRTQLGYGVLVPDSMVPINTGAPDDDGVYITNTSTGESRLLVSLAAIVDQVSYLASDHFARGDFYAFHTKWSPDGQRIMIILRWTPRPARRWPWQKAKPASKKTMRKFVITTAADGSDARIAVRDDWWARGGHHPNWHPDSQHITMNLDLDGTGMKFVSADVFTGEITLLHPTAGGSGHPSVHPGGRFLLTDAYPGEPAGFGDGTVPIRLLDLKTGEEKILVRIQSRPAYVGPRKEMRLDAHPAWDRTGNYVTFNGCPDGTRRVFIADVSAIVSSNS